MAALLLRGCAALLLAARAAAQPAFLAGSPALAQLGAGGCVLSAALSGPAKLFYLVLPAAAPPPLLSDVLATTGRPLPQEVSRYVSREPRRTVSLKPLRSSAVAAPSAAANLTLTDGLASGVAYVAYVSASDGSLASPLATVSFSTPACACSAPALPLPLAPACACAVPWALFQLQAGALLSSTFALGRAALLAGLAASAALQPQQLLALNATAAGDATLLWLALLPASAGEAAPNGAALAALSGGWSALGEGAAAWAAAFPQPFGGVTLLAAQLLAAPPPAGPPATYLVDSSRPQGAVFPRYRAADPGLRPADLVLPSPALEPPSAATFAFISFGATLGGSRPGSRGVSAAAAPPSLPCADCGFACRLDAGAWVNCSSPWAVNGLAPGEHLFQALATTRGGVSDTQAAWAAWAVAAAPWVGWAGGADGTPTNANSTLLLRLQAGPACGGLSYALNGAAAAPLPLAAGAAALALPASALVEGQNNVSVACITSAPPPMPAPATYAWTHDTLPPALQLSPPASFGASSFFSPSLQLPLNASDGGSGLAALSCRLALGPSPSDPAPPGFPDTWTACAGGAPPAAGCACAAPAAGIPSVLQSLLLAGLQALPSGAYYAQAMAADAAGNAATAAAAFSLDDGLAPSPVTGDGAAPPAASGALSAAAAPLLPGAGGGATAFVLVNGVTNGALFLADGSTPVADGAWLPAAAAAAGLRFQPSAGRYSGDANASAFGFNASAADAASADRLGSPPLQVAFSVSFLNSAPMLQPDVYFVLPDAAVAGAEQPGEEAGGGGASLTQLLAAGASDANGDAIGVLLLGCGAVAAGAWEASADGGASWSALCDASPPLLLPPRAGATRLRFAPNASALGCAAARDWAGAASLAFRAWDGSDGGADWAAPFDTAGAYSAAVGALSVTLRGSAGAALLRASAAASAEARAAAAEAARATACAAAPGAAGALLLPAGAGAGAQLLNASGAAWPADLAPAAGWTAEAWVLKTARLASNTLLSSVAGARGPALLLEAAGGGWQLGFRTADGSDVALAAEAPLGVWTHLAFVFDSNTTRLSLFVNGSLAGAAAAGAMPLPLGWLGGPPATPAAFAMDELRLWALPRSQQQLLPAAATRFSAGSAAAPGDPPATAARAGLLAALRFARACAADGDVTLGAGGALGLRVAAGPGADWDPGLLLPCAAVLGLQPASGPPAGGGQVALLGYGFSAPPGPRAACLFGTARAPLLPASNATLALCTAPPAPAGLSGAVPVGYEDPDAGCTAAGWPAAASPAGPSARAGDDAAWAGPPLYTYAQSPRVNSMRPARGPPAGGTLVALTGSGFGPPSGAPADALCRWTRDCGSSCAMYYASARLRSSALAVCEAPPAGGAASARLALSTDGGFGWADAGAFEYSNAFDLFLTQPSPAAADAGGLSAGGGPLLLPGWAPGPGAACAFGSLRPVAARAADGGARCVSPAHAPGAAALALSDNGGADWASPPASAWRFAYADPPAPTLLQPVAAAAGGGARLVLAWDGAPLPAGMPAACLWGSESSARVRALPAPPPRAAPTSSAVSCAGPPPGPGAAFVPLRLLLGSDPGPSINTGLQLLSRAPPALRAAAPAAAEAGGGALLTLTGRGLRVDGAACWLGAASAPLRAFSSALGRCEAPPAAEGWAALRVGEGGAALQPGGIGLRILPPMTLLATRAPPLAPAEGGAQLSVLAPSAAALAPVQALACAVGSVRVAPSAPPRPDAGGALLLCLSPAAAGPSSLPLGLALWGQARFGAGGPLLAVAADAIPDAAATETTMPPAASASGCLLLALPLPPAPLPPGAPLLCLRDDGAEAAAELRPPLAACAAPPAPAPRGGFVLLRLAFAGGGGVPGAGAQQLQYTADARVMAVALPAPLAAGTGGASGRLLLPGRRLWAGRPVSCAGVRLPPRPVCRFGNAAAPGTWVSSALARCEPPQAAFAAGAAAALALADGASGAAGGWLDWSPPGAIFEWVPPGQPDLPWAETVLRPYYGLGRSER